MKELIIVCIILFALLNLYISSSSTINSNPPSYQLVLPSLLQNYTTYEGNKIFKTGLCKDNPNWKYKDDESITCETYTPGNTDCNSDVGINGQLARDACPVSCGLCSTEIEVKRDFDFDSSHFRFPEIDKNLIESKETLKKGYESIVAGDKLNNRLDKLISNIDMANSNTRNKNRNHKFCSNYNLEANLVSKDTYKPSVINPNILRPHNNNTNIIEATENAPTCQDNTNIICDKVTDNPLIQGENKKYFHMDDINQKEYKILDDNQIGDFCKFDKDYIDQDKLDFSKIKETCRKYIRKDNNKYVSLSEDCPHACGECKKDYIKITKDNYINIFPKGIYDNFEFHENKNINIDSCYLREGGYIKDCKFKCNKDGNNVPNEIKNVIIKDGKLEASTKQGICLPVSGPITNKDIDIKCKIDQNVKDMLHTRIDATTNEKVSLRELLNRRDVKPALTNKQYYKDWENRLQTLNIEPELTDAAKMIISPLDDPEKEKTDKDIHSKLWSNRIEYNNSIKEIQKKNKDTYNAIRNLTSCYGTKKWGEEYKLKGDEICKKIKEPIVANSSVQGSRSNRKLIPIEWEDAVCAEYEPKKQITKMDCNNGNNGGGKNHSEAVYNEKYLLNDEINSKWYDPFFKGQRKYRKLISNIPVLYCPKANEDFIVNAI